METVKISGCQQLGQWEETVGGTQKILMDMKLFYGTVEYHNTIMVGTFIQSHKTNAKFEP